MRFNFQVFISYHIFPLALSHCLAFVLSLGRVFIVLIPATTRILTSRQMSHRVHTPNGKWQRWNDSRVSGWKLDGVQKEMNVIKSIESIVPKVKNEKDETKNEKKTHQKIILTVENLSGELRARWNNTKKMNRGGWKITDKWVEVWKQHLQRKRRRRVSAVASERSLADWLNGFGRKLSVHLVTAKQFLFQPKAIKPW